MGRNLLQRGRSSATPLGFTACVAFFLWSCYLPGRLGPTHSAAADWRGKIACIQGMTGMAGRPAGRPLLILRRWRLGATETTGDLDLHFRCIVPGRRHDVMPRCVSPVSGTRSGRRVSAASAEATDYYVVLASARTARLPLSHGAGAPCRAKEVPGRAAWHRLRVCQGERFESAGRRRCCRPLIAA